MPMPMPIPMPMPMPMPIKRAQKLPRYFYYADMNIVLDTAFNYCQSWRASQFRSTLTWSFVTLKAEVRRARPAPSARISIKTLVYFSACIRCPPEAFIDIQLLQGVCTTRTRGMFHSRLGQRPARRTAFRIFQGTLGAYGIASAADHVEEYIRLQSSVAITREISRGQ